ncbi:MAG: aminoacyl-tRNA hydrolase [Thermodesulfobacteriota bacterium]
MQFLIVGLGNPGQEYKNTRHNIGFEVVDKLAEKFNEELTKNGYSSLYTEIAYSGSSLYLVKPKTFMNNSGRAVYEIKSFYKIPTQNMIVIYDELDIPLGNLKIKSGGGAAGHNGIRSILNSTGEADFIRIRFGIGKPKSRDKTVSHVLSRFEKDEKQSVDDNVDTACEAVLEIINNGVKSAMNKFNNKNKD